MATHDYVIANQSGAAFRTDLNNALAAIVSNNSNSSEPATKYAYQWWADTSASILKIRNSSNDGWINLFTLAGGLDVDAASTFSEDVTFEGATSGRNIVFDRSDNSLEWNDNAKATFGAAEDLQIFHDTNNSIIKNSTGFLLFKSDSGINLGDASDTDNYLKTIKDGAVELYFDGTKKFETTSYGVEITGGLELPDSAGGTTANRLKIGAGDDLQIFHNGTNSIISNQTGDLSIRSDNNIVFMDSGANETFAKFIDNGAVELYYNDTKKFETRDAGASLFGDFYMGDDRKIRLGDATGGDLKLYHDGSNSYIQHGTQGNLRYQSNNHDFYNQAGNEFMCRMFNDDAVVLYFDHTSRITTESTGAKVNGKYRQETSGGNIVYAKQVFRESIAANATKTFTITGLAYGNVKLTMGFGDGNFHYATFAAVLGGNMYSVGNAYAAAELLNNRSGVNSITVTKSNSSYAVAIHAGTNQIFGSVVVESNGYDTHSGVTLTIS